MTSPILKTFFKSNQPILTWFISTLFSLYPNSTIFFFNFLIFKIHLIFQVHPYLVKKLENIRNTFSILSMFRWRCACVDRTDHRAREDTHTARKGGKNTKNIILNIRRAHSFFFNSLNNVRKHEECHFFLFFSKTFEIENM